MIRQDVRVPIQTAGGDKMNNAKNEKIADIVAEMREFADTDSQSMGRDVLRRHIQHFARRIEAAAMREVAELRECLKETMADAVAEYKNNSCFRNVKCGEIERCKTCKVDRWRKALREEGGEK